jgi:endonuclease/exonuclease/phosphatase family metal-dependent hydrolase
VARGPDHIRVVTYNAHKCRGLDGRVRPHRIVKVLREIDPDIVALQEIVGAADAKREEDQAGYIASELGFTACMGQNRTINGAPYGNLVLSRYPMRGGVNYDISTTGREPRGCMRADIELPGDALLHVFNVHLGTGYVERREQGSKLLTSEILTNRSLRGARIVLGDFNEWMRGRTTRLLDAELSSVNIRRHIGRSHTYPGILPFLHLDHIYFDPIMAMKSAVLHRSRMALMSSDHLPLVADFCTSGVNTNSDDTQSLRCSS